MSTFEVYLLKREGEDRFDAERVLEALVAGGLVHPSSSDPHRALYRNLDTGVFFHVTLAPPVASLWRSRRRREEGEEEGSGEAEAGEGLAEDDAGGDEEVEEKEEDDEDEDGGDEEAPFDVEMTPLALTVPLLSPAFFGREAVAFAETIARAADLHVDHPEPRGEKGEAGAEKAPVAPEGVPAPTDILASWERSRGELVKSLLEQGQARLDAGPPGAEAPAPKPGAWEGVITTWSLEKAEAWWRYGEARARLEEELGKDGVRVPLIQAARHEGQVKTLCDWHQGTPTVLPRTDLVLLRRERDRKGLFRTRRVIEEGLISGEKLWEILAGACERRREPADIIIYREAASPPQQVTAQLETLVLAPLTEASRTSLFGVIDYDPRAPEARPAG